MAQRFTKRQPTRLPRNGEDTFRPIGALVGGVVSQILARRAATLDEEGRLWAVYCAEGKRGLIRETSPG